jgi:hypothetical protein
MKLPRDMSGDELARRVEGEHRVTIPVHPALRVGTLNSILTAVAAHFERDKAALSRELFR